MLTLPPLSLYVHIPWCVRKCPYCDFNSHTANDTLPEEQYLKTLLSDLENDLDRVQGRKLTSVFFGGGTPSLFSPHSISKLITYFDTVIGFEPDIEITLEANPGAIEQEKFSGFYDAGINRLSIGIQSFTEAHLQTLGRIHSTDEAENAVIAAQAAGFKSINLDLMHGLPNQTPTQALQELEHAVDLQPQHLSWYQLTIEPNTAFYKSPPQLPSDDTLAEIEEQGKLFLKSVNMHQYEVSAYSKPELQSRHNINYWQFGDYLGIGAGAHAKITDIAKGKVFRNQKSRLPAHYMQEKFSSWQAVKSEELVLEFMMNALRLNQGIDASFFSARTGLSAERIEASLNLGRQQNLLNDDPTYIRATDHGQRYLNDVLDLFLSPEKVKVLSP